MYTYLKYEREIIMEKTVNITNFIGVYDNYIALTTAGDNHNIDIIQRD